MQLDLDDLREHYAQLSDDALLEIDDTELVEAAKKVYAEEVQRRKLDDVAAPTDSGASVSESASHPAIAAEDPDWLEDAAEVYSHYARTGAIASPEADDARLALEAAGIPCHLELYEEEAQANATPEPSQRWRVLVPGKLNQYATSVIERDIFNPEFEAQWRSHLEMLSDEDLQAMRPEVAFCGLFDRIERVKRAYREEQSRR